VVRRWFTMLTTSRQLLYPGEPRETWLAVAGQNTGRLVRSVRQGILYL
jgi:hypothetical protein